jgi:ubiquinone/menaquinone biosynthesis C-methylase UbiE
LKRSINQDPWHGPRPLPNPLDVARLGEIYTRTAAFYDGIVAERQAGPKLEALRQLNRQPGERFLEVGVGTAWAFARLIAESGPQNAYGLDVAPGMLEVARQRLAELAQQNPPSHAGERGRRPEPEPPSESQTERPDPHPEPVQGPNAPSLTTPPLLLADARHLPFPDATFDCLLHTYTFEVLATPDIPPVLDECLRVLKPGGRIAVVNLTDGEGPDAAMTEDWKRRYADDPEYFGGARPLHLQRMLEAHGFTRVTRTYVGPHWPSEVLLAHRPSA